MFLLPCKVMAGPFPCVLCLHSKLKETLFTIFQLEFGKKCCCFSVTKLCLTLCDPMDCSAPSLSFTVARDGSNSCPVSRCCYLTISSSATPFSSCLQSFPASKCFPMSWLFTSGGQSIGASASAPVLLMNIQGWFPLGLTGLISLLCPRVLSSATIWKHQFFGA